MDEGTMYHEGARELQERFDTRRLADRLEGITVHTELTEGDVAFVEGARMFFLATADADGAPDCSFKGGVPGFIRAVDPTMLAFPDYDGNGMFRSMGNIAVNPKVGLLFLDFETGWRMRVNGTATLHDDPAELARFEGAQLVVRVAVERIFPNCPRYVPKMQVVEESVYAPRPGHVPPTPEWKEMELFRDHLPGTTPVEA